MNRSRRLLRTALTLPLVLGGAGALAATPFLTQVASAAPSCPTSTTECINTIAGNGTRGYSGDNAPAVNAELNLPSGITTYPTTGYVYFSDSGNNVVRQIANPTTIKTDIITTYAGNGTGGYKGDNGPAAKAELDAPTGVAIDTTNGNLYIADTGNSVVREVVHSTGIIKTVAGNGSCGRLANGGPATSTDLCLPTGVAVSNGNLYISDTGHFEVRVVNLTSGVITDYAGNGTPGYSGDNGPATKAELGTAAGLAVDSSGNLYIADTLDTVVREVSSKGTITTFAGNGKFGYNGDGVAPTKAELDGPTGVGVDQMGDVYISDTLNSRVREVSAGKISTFAGTGTRGYTGDGGPANAAEINTPTGNVAVSGTTVFFSDTGNERLRGVFAGPPPVLPETQWLIALPLGTIALAGGAFFLVGYRRRRQTPQTATA